MKGGKLTLKVGNPEPIGIDVSSLEVRLGTFVLSKRMLNRGEVLPQNFTHTLQLICGCTKQEFLLGFDERDAMLHFACLLDEVLGEYWTRHKILQDNLDDMRLETVWI